MLTASTLSDTVLTFIQQANMQVFHSKCSFSPVGPTACLHYSAQSNSCNANVKLKTVLKQTKKAILEDHLCAEFTRTL